MRKVFLVAILAAAIASPAGAICTAKGTGLQLDIPTFGDSWRLWSVCMRNNFVTLNDNAVSTSTILASTQTIAAQFELVAQSTTALDASKMNRIGSTALGSMTVVDGMSIGAELTASSASFTNTGGDQYALTLSTSTRFLNAGTGIHWADGSISTTASAGDTFVTNKDLHDHLGGDGATILHSSLGGVGAGDHHDKAVSGDITHDSTVGGTTANAHHDKAISGDITHDSTIGGTTDDAHFDHADNLTELNSQITATIADGPHTTNTNAATLCTGSEVLEGSGSCVLGGGTILIDTNTWSAPQTWTAPGNFPQGFQWGDVANHISSAVPGGLILHNLTATRANLQLKGNSPNVLWEDEDNADLTMNVNGGAFQLLGSGSGNLGRTIWDLNTGHVKFRTGPIANQAPDTVVRIGTHGGAKYAIFIETAAALSPLWYVDTDGNQVQLGSMTVMGDGLFLSTVTAKSFEVGIGTDSLKCITGVISGKDMLICGLNIEPTGDNAAFTASLQGVSNRKVFRAVYPWSSTGAGFSANNAGSGQVHELGAQGQDFKSWALKCAGLPCTYQQQSTNARKLAHMFHGDLSQGPHNVIMEINSPTGGTADILQLSSGPVGGFRIIVASITHDGDGRFLGHVNTQDAFRVDDVPGINLDCTPGQGLDDPEISGGILIAGSCGSGGGGGGHILATSSGTGSDLTTKTSRSNLTFDDRFFQVDDDASKDSTFVTVATGSGFIEYACPEGFTRVESGEFLGCISTGEEGSAAWDDANDSCFDTYGGRLPSDTEDFIAKNNYVLTDETDDNEWLDQGAPIGATNDKVYRTAGTIDNTNNQNLANSLAYRCWIPPGSAAPVVKTSGISVPASSSTFIPDGGSTPGQSLGVCVPGSTVTVRMNGGQMLVSFLGSMASGTNGAQYGWGFLVDGEFTTGYSATTRAVSGVEETSRHQNFSADVPVDGLSIGTHSVCWTVSGDGALVWGSLSAGAQVNTTFGAREIRNVAGTGDVATNADNTMTGDNRHTGTLRSDTGLGSGDPVSAKLRDDLGIWKYMRSRDSVTVSSGCAVVWGTHSDGSGDDIDGERVFTSTIGVAVRVNRVAHGGVTLETCSPGQVCKVGTKGIYRVRVVSVTNSACRTSSTRCAVQCDTTTSETIGWNMSNGVGGDTTPPAGTPGDKWLSVGYPND